MARPALRLLRSPARILSSISQRDCCPQWTATPPPPPDGRCHTVAEGVRADRCACTYSLKDRILLLRGAKHEPGGGSRGGLPVRRRPPVPWWFLFAALLLLSTLVWSTLVVVHDNVNVKEHRADHGCCSWRGSPLSPALAEAADAGGGSGSGRARFYHLHMEGSNRNDRSGLLACNESIDKRKNRMKDRVHDANSPTRIDRWRKG